MTDGALPALLRRDRAVVLSGLAAVVVLAWAYLLFGAGIKNGNDGHGRRPDDGDVARMDARLRRPNLRHVGGHDGGDDAAERRAGNPPGRCARSAAQHGERAATGHAVRVRLFARVVRFQPFGDPAAMGVRRGRPAVGNDGGRQSHSGRRRARRGGAYEWTPLKNTCLAHCRSPIAFLLQHWRQGRLGAVVTGMRHGLFCLGCCWILMALLFVGGLMNLLWVAAIALLVLIEKTAPWGGRMARITGVVLAIWGAAALALAI